MRVVSFASADFDFALKLLIFDGTDLWTHATFIMLYSACYPSVADHLLTGVIYQPLVIVWHLSRFGLIHGASE